MFHPKDESAFGKFERNFKILYEAEFTREYKVPWSELSEKDRERIEERERNLHPSGFPYCPLRNGYERIAGSGEKRILVTSMARDMILNTGTIMHTVLQDGLARTGRLLGDYKCLKCGHTHKLCAIPKRCKKCNAKGFYNFAYHEIGGVYKDILYWHTDGVWVANNDKLWAIDFKSSSSYAIDGHKKKPSLPYNYNRIQLETYTDLLKKQHGLKIEGYGLPYISRDAPGFRYAVVGKVLTDDDRERIAKRTKDAIRGFRKVSPILDLKRDGKRETLEWATENKLCDCRKTYDEQVHNKYSPCPLADICFNSKKLGRELDKVVRIKPVETPNA